MPFRTAAPVGLRCPRCPGDRLVHDRVGKLPVLACAGCGGVWLAWLAFRLLQKTQRMLFDVIRSVPYARGVSAPAGPCPRCGDAMVLNDFRRTGVVIDQCLKLHGVWFDAGELRAVAELCYQRLP